MVGHYFIDMDPTYFGRIMTYIRSGDLSYRGLDREDMAEFDKVLDYFQLRFPIREQSPSWDADFCGNKLILQANNRSVSKKYDGCSGVQSAQACSRYSVHIVKGQSVMIGFASRLGFEKHTDNFETCGWFLYVASGRLYAQGGIYNKVYSTSIPVGSVVTAIFHSSQRQIEFDVDGKSLGIAFSDIPCEELFAAADFITSIEETEILIVEKS